MPELSGTRATGDAVEHNARPSILPLPVGEGRGEGDMTVEHATVPNWIRKHVALVLSRLGKTGI